MATTPNCITPAAHVFTTIAVADLLDNLTDAIDTVRASTAVYNKPWMTALDNAWGVILQLETLEYDIAARAWRIESASTPGTVYTSNGDCQCPAFTFGSTGVCYHRAGARLIARALELRDLAAELKAEAHEEGLVWYDADMARIGAKDRIGLIAAVVVEWDAESERQRAALSARIGAAQARMMAQAA